MTFTIPMFWYGFWCGVGTTIVSLVVIVIVVALFSRKK